MEQDVEKGLEKDGESLLTTDSKADQRISCLCFKETPLTTRNTTNA